MGEVPVPPGGQKTPEEGKGGARNKLRNETVGMEVGRHEKDKGEVLEAEQDDADAEGGRVGGVCWHWNLQGS